MNVSSLLGVLTGNSSSGVILEVNLQPPDPNNPQIVPLDHLPSWRLHRNPFWRVQHPYASNNANHINSNNSQFAAVAPAPQRVYAYEISQDVVGQVVVRLPPNSKRGMLEHLGLRVSFIGRIDVSMGVHEGKPHADFSSTSKELAPPGTFYQPETVFNFRFKNMDLIDAAESYHGRNVSVRYLVQARLERKFAPPLTRENDIWMQMIPNKPPGGDESIKMEVGIEDCLHIEFSYPRRIYHLRDTIMGKILFLLVRIKIKHMELALIRRETSGDGLVDTSAGAVTQQPIPTGNAADNANLFTENQTLVKYEIMDGAPVKGELIPVQLCLEGIPADLTPTYAAVHNRFSVKYFLNLVLVDEDDRRYFKQQEIIFWRKELG